MWAKGCLGCGRYRRPVVCIGDPARVTTNKLMVQLSTLIQARNTRSRGAPAVGKPACGFHRDGAWWRGWRVDWLPRELRSLAA